MFLSDEDIERLTGRKRAKAQVAWLHEHGYKIEVNAAGRPVVLRSAVEQRFGAADERPRRAPRLHLLKDR